MDGRVRDTTKLGSSLCGVAYLQDQDMYVLSDVGKPAGVFVVAADKPSQVVRTFQDKTFDKPQNICVQDINGSTTILVSDWRSNTLYLYSVSGKLMRTYGPYTNKLGNLSGPFGVSVGRAGRIVVCDQGNSRVLRVWSDKDGDHWECLLDKEQLGGEPWCVDIDNDNRLMAVRVTESVKLYTF